MTSVRKSLLVVLIAAVVLPGCFLIDKDRLAEDLFTSEPFREAMIDFAIDSYFPDVRDEDAVAVIDDTDLTIVVVFVLHDAAERHRFFRDFVSRTPLGASSREWIDLAIPADSVEAARDALDAGTIHVERIVTLSQLLDVTAGPQSGKPALY